MSYYGFPPYVPVAARRARAEKQLEKLRKKGDAINPVRIEGRTIARTFWGAAWCRHLESFSDFENRLPRGRTYVRNGSVCHLDISSGRIDAKVAGSSLYSVTIAVEPLARAKWEELKSRCSGRISSLIELLAGRLSKEVMTVVTDRDRGLFPLPGEITMSCSCPDWAVMCKHVAAVLYGVGARLDEAPELLFLLRGVDHEELVSAEVARAVGESVAAATRAKSPGSRRRLAAESVGAVFGIDLAGDAAATAATAAPDHGAPAPNATGSEAQAPHPPRSGRPDSVTEVTGSEVARLRAKFGMTQAEFARLLGVSAPSVANWERQSGVLGLRPRSLEAILSVRGLSKRAARKRLGGGSGCGGAC